MAEFSAGLPGHVQVDVPQTKRYAAVLSIGNIVTIHLTHDEAVQLLDDVNDVLDHKAKPGSDADHDYDLHRDRQIEAVG